MQMSALNASVTVGHRFIKPVCCLFVTKMGPEKLLEEMPPKNQTKKTKKQKNNHILFDKTQHEKKPHSV